MATADTRTSASSQAKTLLRNVIRHTDTHNRLLEEAGMWTLHEKMKNGSSNHPGETEAGGRARHRDFRRSGQHTKQDSDVKNSFLYDDRERVSEFSSCNDKRRPFRKAHMDEAYGDSNNADKTKSSTFWLRELYKAEEGSEDRWGHTGYKELYPTDFDSDRSNGCSSSVDSCSSSDSSSTKRKKKRKTSSSRDSHRKKKRRKEKGEKEGKTEKNDKSVGKSEDSKWKRKRKKKKDKDKDKEDKQKRKKKSRDLSQSPSHKKKKRKK